MTKIIVELDTFKYEDMQILLGSDILSRELHFYKEIYKIYVLSIVNVICKNPLLLMRHFIIL